MEAPTYNFRKMQFPTKHLINNITDTLVFLVVVSMIIPIIAVIRLLLPTNNFMTRIDYLIRGRFLILIINIIYFKVTMLTLLNF